MNLVCRVYKASYARGKISCVRPDSALTIFYEDMLRKGLKSLRSFPLLIAEQFIFCRSL